MDADAYNSQQEAIATKAKEKGVAPEVLDAVFDKTLNTIVQEHPGTPPSWRLGRAECLVWEHFFPEEPFPGTLNSSNSGSSKMPRNDGLNQSRERRLTSNDWVHDKYRTDSPDRKRNISPSSGSRLPDHYAGHRIRRSDSGSNSYYREATRDIDTYRPTSRDKAEHHGHGIDKPTVYKSYLEYMVEKAFTAGVSPDSFYRAYYHYGQKAKDEKPAASAYWLLWRQEWMIWHKFFGVGFIGSEPKQGPTTRDTAPANFSVMTSPKLWSILKSSPAYGRLVEESDLVESVPTTSSHPQKVLLPISTSSSTTHRGRNDLQHQSHPIVPNNSTHEIRNDLQLQPSKLLTAQATARKVSSRTLQAAFEEKRRLVKDHYPKQSAEWQLWFIEAIIWGELFRNATFSKQEPRPHHDPAASGFAQNPIRDSGNISSYSPQEKLMEGMALKQGIRREFYQYLNTARHDAIAVYPRCSCFARHFFADRLTWRQFFKQPFPFAWPRQDHHPECRAYFHGSSSSIKTQAVPMPLKSEDHEGTAQASQRASAGRNPANVTAPMPSPSTLERSVVMKPAQSQHPVIKATPSQLPARNDQPHTTKVQHSSCSDFASTRASAPVQSPPSQGINIRLPAGPSSSQPLSTQRSHTELVRAQDAEVGSTSKVVSVSAAQSPQELPVPVDIMAALTDVRKENVMKGNVIPDGAVVMQNMDSTICKIETVTLMFRCLLAEDAASMTSFSNGLKCHFRYKQIWNGDLLLWVEPFSLRDTAAFSGGHLFLTGWVQRNLKFGVVQPSFYWNEIKNHPGFKQEAPAPIQAHSAVLLSKDDHGNITQSANTTDSTTDNTKQKLDAVLIICGDHMPCSSGNLKNMAFSFLIDGSKEQVEQRLRCNFLLKESLNKNAEWELQLDVKPVLATDEEGFKKATRFLQAWALRAMKSVPYKPSTFLSSPEGLEIVGRPSISSGLSSSDLEKTGSLFDASDLDLLFSEEAAKAEGNSRLVLDEVTGEVISLRELLKKTLYRASAKMLESFVLSSTPSNLISVVTGGEEDDEDDDEVRVFGTDGQMKDMGGGRFIVIQSQKQAQAFGSVPAKRKLQEAFGECAEKKVCSSSSNERDVVDKAVIESDPTLGKFAENSVSLPVVEVAECVEPDEVDPSVCMTDSPGPIAVDDPAAVPSETGPKAVETSESANGKRKAEEELVNHAEKKVCV